MSQLPELRQIVLLTADLEGALKTAREFFEVPVGYRAVEDMAEIGFIHEVFGFDRTYIEICQPIDPESSMGRRAARADSGFMVVIQVDDADAMLDRAAALDLKPLFTKDLHGSPISQWHPRDFGTIAEIDEMRPSDSWHFAPAIYGARSTAVVEDIVAAELAVADPERDGRAVGDGDRRRRRMARRSRSVTGCCGSARPLMWSGWSASTAKQPIEDGPARRCGCATSTSGWSDHAVTKRTSGRSRR